MATTQQVTALYKEILGRAPDAGGLKFYSGWSDPNAIRNDMLGSAEYKAKKSAPASSSKPKNVSQPLFDFSAEQTKQTNALLAKQKAEQEGLFGQYSTKLEGQEQLPALYTRLQGELGIPELSEQAGAFKNEIFRVKGLLDHLDEDVNSRTSGTYTTEAMRRRMLAAEGGDMQTTLGRLGTGLEPISEMLTGAQGQLSALLPLTIQQQNKELQPLEMQINALGDRFAREITGFNSNKELQLTALMDKLERDRFLSDRDWELAQQLAAEERDFSHQKQLATISAGQYLTPKSSIAPTSSASSVSTRQLPSLPKVAPVVSSKPVAPQLLPNSSALFQPGLNLFSALGYK